MDTVKSVAAEQGLSRSRASKRSPIWPKRDIFWERLILSLTVLSAALIILIFVFILQEAWPVIRANGLSLVTTTGFDKQVYNAYYAPANAPVWNFGLLSLIAGTAATTCGALLVAVPAGVGTAIIISEIARGSLKRFLLSIIRLLAAIPSVIYGLVGLMVVVPFIRDNLLTVDIQIKYLQYFQLSGNSMLAGILVLSFMILPIITALSADAIRAVPLEYREASLALGVSKWRTITRVVVPAAKSGILAGTVLGTGRAIGEAIALSMVCGGNAVLPSLTHGFVFFLTPVLPLASAIVNKSEAISVPSIEAALFACGVVLLIMSSFLSVATKAVESAVRRRQGLD